MGSPVQAAEVAPESGPTGGAGGGKSGGGGGDPTGGLGLGGDTSGMGGMNPAMGFDANTLASLSDPGAAGVQQQMAARGFSQVQQPLTDQPGAVAQQPQQGSQQQVPLPRERPPMTAEQMAQAIFHGPAGPSGTPGADPFSGRFGATESPASFAEQFGASDPSNIYNNTASPGLPPNQFNARFAGNPPPGPISDLPLQTAPGELTQQMAGLGSSPLGGAQPPAATPPETTAAAPPATATPPATSADVPLPPSRPNTGQDLPATATPQVTPPGTPAPAGTAPQTPLEQVLSDFVHMLFGGGQGGFSGLERMIASMLGINPRWMFPGFYSGFNRPPGPGYFPPGTVGGRAVPPAGPPGPQSPQVPPRQMPGTPTAPQAPQPRAPLPTPDPRGRQRFPGPPYTADRADRPPPWYRPEQNPAQRARPASDIPRPPGDIPPRPSAEPDIPRPPADIPGGRLPRLANVDPRLQNMLDGAKAKFEARNPGYRVVPTSGFRGGRGEAQHGRGMAEDLQIIGPNGPIPNKGADTTGLYRQFARLAYGEQLARYPELNGKFAWGGAFGTQTQARGGGGPPDLMHFDIGGERGHWTQSRPSRMGPLSQIEDTMQAG